MKRSVLIGTSVLGCAAALGVAGASAAPSAAPARRVIHLTGTMTSFTSAVDAKPKGPSAGDLGYVGGRLYRGGKLAGRYSGVCAQLPGGTQQCTFVLGLPEGQIILTAGYGPAMNTGAVAHEAVIGGTGAYKGARGQGDDRELSNTKLAFTLQLMP
jgi:hypothetical protein